MVLQTEKKQQATVDKKIMHIDKTPKPSYNGKGRLHVQKSKDMLRIQLTTVGTRICLDIRRCIPSQEGKGEPIPTSRGVSISPDKIREVLSAIENAGNRPVYIEL